MASTANLRSRRSAAQLHALVGVEREISAQDSHGRRKYLREFNQAFRTYQSVLTLQDVQNELHSADIVLVGDYHALPTSQRFTASLLEQRAMTGDRAIVLGVETIFARDQHVVDEWWRREIDESELRQRIRFDLDWGYDWAPFYELLVAARDHGEAIYGLDCMPRESLRQIGARDRHAAAKMAEIRGRHPEAVILVLFGESHLAPGHLPRLLRKQLPEARILTVLQNVDALYWRAAGESADKVDAVRVNDDVLCVFNATPLEKYESYRLFLDQWSRCESGPDFGPTVYNLVDSLANFLEIDRYSPHNSTQPKFLVDLLPEVHGHVSEAMLQRLLARKVLDSRELEAMLTNVNERGSTYLPQLNAFWIREFQLVHAAEDAARFLHHACRGLPNRLHAGGSNGAGAGKNFGDDVDSDRSGLFYRQLVEVALGDFGSRVLYPARIMPEVEDRRITRALLDRAASAVVDADMQRMLSTAKALGYRLGSLLYAAYLEGKIKPAAFRRWFLIHLDEPASARTVIHSMIAKTREA